MFYFTGLSTDICSNFVISNCFFISNSRKFHTWFKKKIKYQYSVKVPKLIGILWHLDPKQLPLVLYNLNTSIPLDINVILLVPYCIFVSQLSWTNIFIFSVIDTLNFSYIPFSSILLVTLNQYNVTVGNLSVMWLMI